MTPEPISHPAEGAVEAQAQRDHPLAKRLLKVLTTAMDFAGTMPAKAAVKLRPADWQAVERVIREAAAALTPDPAKAGQADEVAKLRAEAAATLSEWVVAFWQEKKARDAAEARNKVLEEALRFYGDDVNYSQRGALNPTQVGFTGPETARSALSQAREGDEHGE